MIQIGDMQGSKSLGNLLHPKFPFIYIWHSLVFFKLCDTCYNVLLNLEWSKHYIIFKKRKYWTRLNQNQVFKFKLVDGKINPWNEKQKKIWK